MQKEVKNMYNRSLDFASRNLRYGGVALTITAAYIAVARPSTITILLTPFSGDSVILGKVLALTGILSTVLGYALKK